MSTGRVHSLQSLGTLDGPGIRFVVFLQGCHLRCACCHNPDTWAMNEGTEYTAEEIVSRALRFREYFGVEGGITLSGGEPAEQAAACAELAHRAHQKGLNVWLYSGSTYEKLSERAQTDAELQRLLDEADVLVDGPFILAERSLELDFCGSRNQRLIDMNRTRESGSVVLWTPPVW